MKLEVKKLCGGYGSKLVLEDLDFELESGSVTLCWAPTAAANPPC